MIREFDGWTIGYALIMGEKNALPLEERAFQPQQNE